MVAKIPALVPKFFKILFIVLGLALLASRATADTELIIIIFFAEKKFSW